jgi:hypothetical protein
MLSEFLTAAQHDNSRLRAANLIDITNPEHRAPGRVVAKSKTEFVETS